MKKIARRLLPLLLLAGSAAAGSYADRDDVRDFVRDMAHKHGFERGELLAALDRVERDDRVIRLITPPTTPAARSWHRYRSNFLNDQRVDGGVAFWKEHEATLEAASARYGVPPEIIVAIIGVETLYGRNTGSFEALAALTTLAFDYPPRSALFQRELENLFLLAREQGRDPSSYYGSYAGAIGYPQFLPSSVRHYAVDLDGDGRIDFESDPIDAIGSVANYLAEHGWQRGEPVAVRAYLPPGTDARELVQAGIEPTLAPARLAEAGVITRPGTAHQGPATLVDLVTPGADTEYWLGYRNFYVITRYNKSSFYAMAVFELAEAVRARRSPGLAHLRTE